jgi:hypothetical protein
MKALYAIKDRRKDAKEELSVGFRNRLHKVAPV